MTFEMMLKKRAQTLIQQELGHIRSIASAEFPEREEEAFLELAQVFLKNIALGASKVLSPEETITALNVFLTNNGNTK